MGGFPLNQILKEHDWTSTSVKSSTNSVYITTPDGTNIAADVSVPQNGQESAKYPTVLIATRYWRSFKMWVPQPPNSTFIGPRNDLSKYLAQRGFSIVVMDVRGTGASTGVQEAPFSESEIKDIYHVVDWIASQPWSNGAVGATGISYEGSTSQLLALQSHPNVMAVNVAEIEMDLYDDVVYPGGILNFGFINAWSEANTYLDSNRIAPWFPFIIRLLGRGVLPVGNSTELLEKALKDHTSNIDVYASATKVLFKDDPFGISTLQALSPLERIKNQNQIVVPHLCWGGWLDAATARTVLTRFELFGNIPQIAIIGPWNHEMNTNCSLFKKGNLDPLEKVQFELIARFFHSALVMQAPITENVLYYYTMGVEEWRKTSTWPIVKEQTIFYFGKSMNLEDTKPTTETELAEFKVDYSATTTKTNRWYTQLLRPLHYSDRKSQSKKCCVFKAPRLTVPTEITGSPKLELIMSSSIPDTNIFVYLEAESPSGFVHYITEGMKRSIHGTDSMLSVDKREITPVHPFHVNITLLPTSIVLPAGYCLRIALAGSDADTFVSNIGDCQWKIFAGSLISLPIVQ